MKPLVKTITHALAALGLAGAAITPALAGEPAAMTINVSAADLDLATAQGQKTLAQRVEKAARAVCRTAAATTGSRILSREAQACLAQARKDVKQQVSAMTFSNEQRGG